MNNVLLSKILNINSPILITGPSGTGKSQLAKKIFTHSKINREQFLTLHLASIKEDLFESELFGHKKGSFTGANENKIGYFQEVGKGTLFLDEIGELSLESQKKLLYVLEEKKFTPVGSTHALDFQGRLVMATNKDLKALVAAGKFREDLYFRLSIFHLELASINQDKGKLSKAIEQCFEEMKMRYQKPFLKKCSEVESLLLGATWRGNYRELKNCLEYMVVVSDGDYLRKKDFPQWFLDELKPASLGTKGECVFDLPSDYSEALAYFEELYLKAMLERFSGRVNETARTIGISKTTLINKAKKYQINTLQIRAEASIQKECSLAA